MFINLFLLVLHNMVSDSRLEKIKRVVSQRQAGLVVVIEDIHDPHKAEAIFRTCDAFGVQDVYLIFDKTEPWNPAKIGKQSSSSAHKWLTFHTFRSAAECLEYLKEKGYVIVATALKDEAIYLFDYSFGKKKIALMIGNEHQGLSDAALARADAVLKIQMRGMVESLNVSVASAVFLAELTRQRAALGRTFALTRGEQQALEEQLMLQSRKRKQHT